jgi:hypothetical protein
MTTTAVIVIMASVIATDSDLVAAAARNFGAEVHVRIPCQLFASAKGKHDPTVPSADDIEHLPERHGARSRGVPRAWAWPIRPDPIYDHGWYEVQSARDRLGE